jgi:redox-sensitive bicupin YhaK (pirin superfamily)
MLYPCAPAAVAEPDSVLLPGHDVPLGRYTIVRRMLPQRELRTVGAWCFVDEFGPDEVEDRPGMRIGPHPHTGLQTVSWLIAGEVLHRDSLGSLQSIMPGQLNVMTAGRGIAHSEESPAVHPPVMHGLQLWVALPEDARHGEPRFEHYPAVPVLGLDEARVTVVVGALGGVVSPAVVHSPLLGADIEVHGAARLPLEPSFEHAVLVTSGRAEVAGVALDKGTLLYLSLGRTDLALRASGGAARLFLLGGEPFEEPLVMWWNFVGRTHEDIVQAREDWMAGRRFGTVSGFDGDRLPAPAMPTTRLKSRTRRGGTAG